MLLFQAGVALLTFIAASLLVLAQGAAAIVSYHIIFAIGVVPLILGAMVHFIPVLSRSRNPPPYMHLLPIAALLGGALLNAHLIFPQTLPAGQQIGAVIVTGSMLSIVIWAYRLKKRSIGRPHPCLDWYLAALIFLLIAVGAILMSHLLPAQRAAFRLLHLHLNTLGFIGITAVGTMQVLLPTTARQQDPQTAPRMQRQLKWMIAGVAITSFGAAWSANLAWIGMTLILVSLLGVFRAWIPLYADQLFNAHGATASLGAALVGYLSAVIMGAIHPYHQAVIYPAAAFAIGFLMPLVTGAVSYLLPLWLRPGQQTDWHQTIRQHLGFGAGWRALTFLAGGVTAGLGHVAGWYLATFAASLFLAQALLLPVTWRLTILRRKL